MLRLGLTIARRNIASAWKATKNFITSTGAVFHTSAGEIFNVK